METCPRLLRYSAVVLLGVLFLGTAFGVTASSKQAPATVATSGIERTVVVQSSVSVSPGATSSVNPNPPSGVVRLVFIHHSCGNNWLDDDNGGLGAALGANNYYVSDTYYDWGPDNIGSYTDIGHWWDWFRGPDRGTYTDAVYNTTNRHADYSRPMPKPGGPNEIIMFKSCYPNSELEGDPGDPPTTGDNPLRGEGWDSQHHTVGNAKGIYSDILEYFGTRQDKLFVVVTAPPVQDDTYADNARALNNWLVNDWLADYPYHNVAVFDFYNVLTTNGGDADTNDYGLSTGNHHRVVTSATPVVVEHVTDGDDDDSPNVLEYPTNSGDDHPTPAGNEKATGEFVPLLNAYYNCWKYGQCWSGSAPWISVTANPDVLTISPGEAAESEILVTASADVASPVTLTLEGAPLGTTASLDPDLVTPPGTSQLRITSSPSTAAGVYPIVVTGEVGALTDVANLALQVFPFKTYLPVVLRGG